MAVPTELRTTAFGGLVVIATLFVGLGAWGSTAELSSAVIAQGRVTVDTNRKTVKHLKGGIVREILVRNGDRVAAGQVLFRLDDTEAEAQLTNLQQKLDLARVVEARLLAERRDAGRIAFPKDLWSRREEPKVAKVLQNQTDLFAARRASLHGEFDVSRRRIGHTGDEIAGFEADIASKQREARLVREELKAQKHLLAKGLTTRSRVLRLEQKVAALEGRVETLRAQIARARKAIGDAEMHVLQARRDFREKVEMELRDARAEIFELRERISTARFLFEEMEIRAPEAGVVVNRQIHAPGAVLRPGDAVLDLVPTQDALIVEALVRPIDIDSLAVGQQADIRFTAFAQRTTPVLRGEVTYLAADVEEDARSGQNHYLVRVAVPEAEVARLGGNRLQSGMPADVAINTGERTVLDYLVQPLRDSAFKAMREQ